ncbi:hypothetical protein [Acinetobacter soli]|uniref:hypothetical protein n=1 Tax=Acinetobacter soli TaxID=487316 RepID=UPI001D09F222|nr:hypothetical protein [Acinetobacter soli]MCB8769366.1 hypothetical protein [Acinetobacter soli]
MSKFSFYTASFPYDFNTLVDFFEKKSTKKNEYITIIKKRTHYIELKYHQDQIVTEEYLDTNNKKNIIERLSTKEIIFRIYNRERYNFLIINQPRGIINLKNFLSKLFLFEFFITKEFIDLNQLIEKESEQIDYIFKVELREALYPDNIFAKHTFYTQNKSVNVLGPFISLLKTNYYSIFKVELFFKNYVNIKFVIKNDASFSSIGLSDDEAIKFIFSNLTI